MIDEREKPTRFDVVRWFNRTGLIAIATMSIVFMAGQVSINGMVAPLTPLTAKIQAASEQAIRAQTISILATKLEEAKRPGMLYTYRTQLASEVNEFEAVHRGLKFGDNTRGLTASMSATVRQQIFDPVNGLDRFARDFIDQVRRDFLSNALTVDDGFADQLSSTVHLQLSPRLGDLTGLLADETRRSVQRVLAAQVFLFALSILAMLILGRFVYRPLANKIILEFIGDTDTQPANLMRFDEVTGLANRAHLLAFMTEHCGFIQSNDLRSAILDIEVQGLDAVREELDTSDCDELLTMIARRIESVCRSGDFIARVGLNEFVIVLTSFDDDTALNDMTNALRTKLTLPLVVDQQSFNFKTKIGIKIATAKDKVPAAILNQAATALKSSKASDNYDIQFFSGNVAPKAKQREQDIKQIKEGLKNGQFIAHFQPFVDTETSETLGLEAFARWQNPKRGLLSPIHFIEIVKNSNLTNDVTRTVLGDALKALKEWQSKSISVPYISINIDISQLNDKTFVDELKWIMDSYDLPPSRIALEFSERAFHPDSPAEMRENAKRLAAFGFRMILDDFGTAGVRLTSINGVKLEHVKLDRAFIANLDSDTQQQRTTRDLIDQARSNRIKIVASGVETPAERSILTRMKADAIQGYLVCEPIEADRMTQWLGHVSTASDLKSA